MKTRLTKQAIKQADQKDRPYYLWDTTTRGLGVRITPTGIKTFVLTYRDRHGVQKFPVLGRCSSMTLDEARHKAGVWLGLIREGADPREEEMRPRKDLSLSEFSELYLRDYAIPHKKPKSVINDRSLLRKNILPSLGKKRLNALTEKDVARLHASMAGRPYAANRTMALLKTVFGLAIRWGYLSEGNPAAGVRKFKEASRERFFSPVELAGIFQALNEIETARLHDTGAINAVRLLALTGCRLREILHLQWRDIDLPMGCLHLDDTKTGQRVIYLNRPAVLILDRIERHGEYVFPSPTRPGQPIDTVRKLWLRVCKMAGIEGARIHDLRHAFASVLASGGESLLIIGKLLGHTESRTTERYSHLQSDPLRAAAERVGDIMAPLMDGDGAQIVEIGPPGAGDDEDKAETAQDAP